MISDRKLKILEAIIHDYITLAEPISSRTIAKNHDLSLSSATIRNEMSDLEEMGYITALHTSSGRVPSDKGYRLYVDKGLKKRRLSQEEKLMLHRALRDSGRDLENIVKEMAKAISLLTNYTTLATKPVARRHKIKQLYVLPVEGNVVALVMITDLNKVKNQVVSLPVANVDSSLIAQISAVLTELLSGCDIADLNELYLIMVQHRFKEMGFDEDVARVLLNAVRASLVMADDIEVYTVGMKNILRFPEFSDNARAKSLVGILEEKEGLLTLLEDNWDEVQITIGSENQNENLQDCSIIRAKITIDGHFCGNLAILGPTRMDYAQVLSVLHGILNNL